eukprot:Opistho-2@36336
MSGGHGPRHVRLVQSIVNGGLGPLALGRALRGSHGRRWPLGMCGRLLSVVHCSIVHCAVVGCAVVAVVCHAAGGSHVGEILNRVHAASEAGGIESGEESHHLCCLEFTALEAALSLFRHYLECVELCSEAVDGLDERLASVLNVALAVFFQALEVFVGYATFLHHAPRGLATHLRQQIRAIALKVGVLKLPVKRAVRRVAHVAWLLGVDHFVKSIHVQLADKAGEVVVLEETRKHVPRKEVGIVHQNAVARHAPSNHIAALRILHHPEKRRRKKRGAGKSVLKLGSVHLRSFWRKAGAVDSASVAIFVSKCCECEVLGNIEVLSVLFSML